ncbi:MAG: ABC transporter ATP-binding protein [Micropruina sp.]|nr:ABC transporter ATP-binding protein [Micropruina sp.]
MSCRFGEIQAVDEVSLEIPHGAVFGLLGPDGAGKSTLIRMLATVQRASSGDAFVFGSSVTREPHRVTPRLGYMSQRFSMYPDLTVAENIDFFATLRGVPRAERLTRAASLLTSMGLAEFAGRQAGRLSGGMKQKLTLAVTLMHQPDLLLLDEPTTGVDPVARREFWRILAGLHRGGTTVLVSTPYMDEAERCTDVAFMEAGQIRHRGSPQQIKQLVPGTLLEVAAENPREALAVVRRAPQATSVHLYGDLVRVLWASGADVKELDRWLSGQGLTATVRPIVVDMETAFAFLADVGVGGGEPR